MFFHTEFFWTRMKNWSFLNKNTFSFGTCGRWRFRVGQPCLPESVTCWLKRLCSLMLLVNHQSEPLPVDKQSSSNCLVSTSDDVKCVTSHTCNHSWCGFVFGSSGLQMFQFWQSESKSNRDHVTLTNTTEEESDQTESNVCFGIRVKTLKLKNRSSDGASSWITHNTFSHDPSLSCFILHVPSQTEVWRIKTALFFLRMASMVVRKVNV